jgi:hypothetical protein
MYDSGLIVSVIDNIFIKFFMLKGTIKLKNLKGQSRFMLILTINFHLEIAFVRRKNTLINPSRNKENSSADN